MRYELFFPWAVIVECVIAGVYYLSVGDWRNAAFWLSVAVCDAAVVW